jgi:hypothetical protein
VSGWYILDDDHRAMPCDENAGLVWLEEDPNRRRVTKTFVGRFLVSTVFLGFDHAWGDGPPQLFETMIFGRDNPLPDDQWRWATWDAAEAGHRRIVTLLESAQRWRILRPFRILFGWLGSGGGRN